MSEETQVDTAPASVDTAPAAGTYTHHDDTQQAQQEQAPQDDGKRPPLAKSSQEGEEQPNPNRQQLNEFKLPDEYKDKPWAEKIKTADDAYKQIDNLTALVGKKTIKPIDYETATPEQVADHYKSLAPEKVEDYDFGENADPEFSGFVGEVFQEAGIDPNQAKMVSEAINEGIGKFAPDTSADGYINPMKESFPENHEQVIAGVEKALLANASDEDKGVFDEVDNKTRIAIDRTVHAITEGYETRIQNILKEHGIKETGAHAEGGAGSPATDITSVRQGLRAEIAALDTRAHDASEKQELVNKLAATYK